MVVQRRHPIQRIFNACWVGVRLQKWVQHYIECIRENVECHILELEGKLGCCRVIASESFTIAPRGEVVAYCEVCFPPGNTRSSGGLGIVAPRDHFLELNKGLVGRTLVQNNSKVPVRFMNLSADANSIYKGTNIGYLVQALQVFEEGISTRIKQPWSKEFVDLKKKHYPSWTVNSKRK